MSKRKYSSALKIGNKRELSADIVTCEVTFLVEMEDVY